MKLYNTLTRDYESLEKLAGDSVKVYLCGVTVYDDSHIGHARTIVVLDVLHRYLLYKKVNVKFVQNFTDVDDKIINRAKSENKTYDEVSKKYIQRFYEDFGRLNIVLSEIQFPYATQYIDEMIKIIEILIEKGNAYVTLNGIYYNVKSFPDYGKLSKKTTGELESGARVEIDPLKKDSLDFALWKFSNEIPSWPSPWGSGRPGWHIECSAMALKILGETIDIHAGGNDLIFPHHENEIAQSEAVTGKQFAKIWIHTGMVNINSEKMSKSLGNIISVNNAVDEYSGNIIRLFSISIHYSKPLDYTENALEEALLKWRQIEHCAFELMFPNSLVDSPDQNNLENEKEKYNQEIENMKKQCIEFIDSFFDELENDLNTSMALSAFLKLVSEINNFASKDKITPILAEFLLPKFQDCMYILGLKINMPDKETIEEISEKIKKRDQFRINKDFEKADQIRKELMENYSIELIDHQKRTIWKRIEKIKHLRINQ